jgi:hypothetical protein
MTTVDSSEHTVGKGQTVLASARVGAVVGLTGGALVGLAESVGVLFSTLGPPASAELAQVARLVLGLVFLLVLTALGAALGMAALGALLGVWQVWRRAMMSAARQATLLGAAFIVLYVLFRAMDSLGIGELSRAGGQLTLWALVLLCLIAGVGWGAWFVLKRVLENGE